MIKRIVKRQNRFYDTSRFGQPEIRVHHKAGKGNQFLQKLTAKLTE